MVQNNMFTFPACWRQRICVLFFTEKQLWPIKIFSEHWSMSFERANIIPQNSFAFEEIDSVSRIHRICWGRKPSLHQEKDDHNVIRWIFLLKFLYGWDFPSSHKVHTDQGKTLLRRLCVQWGLPLKSHECLQQKSVFNTKYHLNLLRILLYKEIEKALHCCEISFYVSTK